ncbi:hypothetical protein EDD85DRAFT_921863 [Armillaria nabsnona]|nr:hypothetical protein EDD85DRAFT_921863 [Armillaria nabsnona]
MEEVELWKQNPIECIRELMGNSRFAEHMKYAPEWVYTNENSQLQAYSEMSTADWWWAIQVSSITVMRTSLIKWQQKLLPKGATIAAPSEHVAVLIGYLPVSKFESFSKKTRSIQSYQLFHTCMHSLLDSLVEAGKNGVEMLCVHGKTRLQCLVRCCMENCCPKCVSKSELLDPEKMINILKQTSDSHKPKVFTKQGLHPVDPFWRKLPHCKNFNCFTPNILHQFHKGMFKDHVLKEELNCHFRAMTHHPSLHHFKKGISLVTLMSLQVLYAQNSQIYPDN